MSREINDLSIREQKELLICYDVRRLRYISKVDAALILDMTPVSLKMLLNNRKVINKYKGTTYTPTIDNLLRTIDTKTNINQQMINMETFLINWIFTKENLNLMVTTTALFRKARAVARHNGIKKFTPTLSWLNHFKFKYSIFNREVNQIIHDQQITAIDLSTTSNWLKNFLGNVRGDYNADDIYCLCETSFVCSPIITEDVQRSLDTESQQLEEKLSILFSCNITATDRIIPLVLVNNQRSPFGQRVMENLDANSSDECWSVSCYHSFWKKWDRHIWPRRILVILDIRLAHPKIKLHNIEVRSIPNFLPAVVHPLSLTIMGIAMMVNYHVKQLLPQEFVNLEDIGYVATSGHINILDYMYMLTETWRTMPSALIRNRLRTIGLIETDMEVLGEINETYINQLILGCPSLINNHPEIINNMRIENKQDIFSAHKAAANVQLQTENNRNGDELITLMHYPKVEGVITGIYQKDKQRDGINDNTGQFT